MTPAVRLPAALRAGIEAHARATFPRECCGLLEGVEMPGTIEIRAVHPANNLAAEPDRFEIDPADQFRLLRGARERNTEIVGCYHSHPNGVCEPSPRDAEFADEDGFVWLIAALTAPDTPVTLAAFVFERGAFRALSLSPPRRYKPAVPRMLPSSSG